ncbi:fluoride efflux transporter CrcB, partial [Streptomyces sp. NPDC087894]|uniref:fluoride efflux transporter CrcB n=1 Tax=Streptomyces sp. NPDC087894 TaxID=3365816 RepID=UPI003813A857
MSDFLLVAIGGAVGAPLRYLTDRAVQARHDTVFPWGTFSVNVVGSLILGILTGAALSGTSGHTVHLLLGTGLCGALTTYSTFSYETLRLAESGAKKPSHLGDSVVCSSWWGSLSGLCRTSCGSCSS